MRRNAKTGVVAVRATNLALRAAARLKSMVDASCQGRYLSPHSTHVRWVAAWMVGFAGWRGCGARVGNFAKRASGERAPSIFRSWHSLRSSQRRESGVDIADGTSLFSLSRRSRRVCLGALPRRFCLAEFARAAVSHILSPGRKTVLSTNWASGAFESLSSNTREVYCRIRASPRSSLFPCNISRDRPRERTIFFRGPFRTRYYCSCP